MNQPTTIFLPDDFDRIYIKYFKKLKDENRLKYDPSGWLNTISKASEKYTFHESEKQLAITPYYTDYYDQLSEFKEPISRLISEWDNYSYGLQEFTLCSSVSLGSLAIISFLSTTKIKHIFFETPAYYASINQAKSLSMPYSLMPTYKIDQFQLDLDIDQMKANSPFAIWLTQPRMSLGTNQEIAFIREVYNKIPDNCYIIVDEASEQLFPSHLHSLTIEQFPRLIRIRNIYKGLGINGVRMSYIIHHASLRESVQREIENFQGALDYFSLVHTVYWGDHIPQFQIMSEIANSQTSLMRENLARRFNDEYISFSRLVNGYVGSFSVLLSKKKGSHRKNREDLLKNCYENGISIILGATMKFAYHEQQEFIRVNYFKPPTQIEGAVEIISDYLRR